MMNATLAKSTFTEDLYQLPQRVLVLIPGSWNKVSDAEQQLLARILGSVKLSLASVQVVSAASFSREEAAVYRAKTILSFGVPVAGHSSSYEAVTLDDVTVVVADTIETLDDVRKKNLWTALKLVFKL
jgi:hypothetical protein